MKEQRTWHALVAPAVLNLLGVAFIAYGASVLLDPPPVRRGLYGAAGTPPLVIAAGLFFIVLAPMIYRHTRREALRNRKQKKQRKRKEQWPWKEDKYW